MNEGKRRKIVVQGVILGEQQTVVSELQSEA
jgi:hypothetical protein